MLQVEVVCFAAAAVCLVREQDRACRRSEVWVRPARRGCFPLERVVCFPAWVPAAVHLRCRAAATTGSGSAGAAGQLLDAGSPLAVISANIQDEIIARAREIGADFLPKPLTKQALAEFISRAEKRLATMVG